MGKFEPHDDGNTIILFSHLLKKMSCCALKSTYTPCRNWSLLESELCHVHQNMDPEVMKDRWFKRYVLGLTYTLFTYEKDWYDRNLILGPLKSGRFTLTKEDILKIPNREKYIDVFLLLVEHGFIPRGVHLRQESTCRWFFCFLMTDFPTKDPLPNLRKKLEELYVLHSGKVLYDFLIWLPYPLLNRSRMTKRFRAYIPTILDSSAAKEPSWMPHKELDNIRLEYEKIIGHDKATQRCLVERWLPDLKELYQTEKQIQKIKMNHCKEELMMNRWHPDRVSAYLEMGIDLDDI